MGTRRKGRECALQILYQVEVLASSKQAGSSDAAAPSNPIADLSKAHLGQAIEQYFANFDAPEEVYDYASSLVHGTHLNLIRIDEMISRHSTKWRLERMAIVDRNVLRVATYELFFSTDLPSGVIIDEAIEIARRFGSERSAAFVNGVLDSIATDIRRPSNGGLKK
jgi:N utilization substance protein B